MDGFKSTHSDDIRLTFELSVDYLDIDTLYTMSRGPTPILSEEYVISSLVKRYGNVAKTYLSLAKIWFKAQPKRRLDIHNRDMGPAEQLTVEEIFFSHMFKLVPCQRNMRSSSFAQSIIDNNLQLFLLFSKDNTLWKYEVVEYFNLSVKHRSFEISLAICKETDLLSINHVAFNYGRRDLIDMEIPVKKKDLMDFLRAAIRSGDTKLLDCFLHLSRKDMEWVRSQMTHISLDIITSRSIPMLNYVVCQGKTIEKRAGSWKRLYGRGMKDEDVDAFYEALSDKCNYVPPFHINQLCQCNMINSPRLKCLTMEQEASVLEEFILNSRESQGTDVFFYLWNRATIHTKDRCLIKINDQYIYLHPDITVTLWNHAKTFGDYNLRGSILNSIFLDIYSEGDIFQMSLISNDMVHLMHNNISHCTLKKWKSEDLFRKASLDKFIRDVFKNKTDLKSQQ